MRPTIRRVTRYKWFSKGHEIPGIALIGAHGILAPHDPR